MDDPEKPIKESISYEFFEMESVHIACIRDLSVEEKAKEAALYSSVSEEDKSNFVHTYAYRHLLLLPSCQDALQLWASGAISGDKIPDEVLDFSSSSLMMPILPKDAKDKDPVIDYVQFERLQAWSLLTKATPSVSPPSTTFLAVLKQLDKAVLAGYTNHFFYTHPEYMKYATMIDDSRKQLLLSLIKLRKSISYNT